MEVNVLNYSPVKFVGITLQISEKRLGFKI